MSKSQKIRSILFQPVLLVLAACVLIIAGTNSFASQSIPEDPAGRVEYYLKVGQRLEAEKAYDELLKTDPGDLDLQYAYLTNHAQLSSGASSADRNQVLIDSYTELASAKATENIGNFALGYLLFQNGDYQGALDHYLQVGEPGQKYLNLEIGKTYLKLEQPDQAESYFQREISFNGYLAQAVPALASLYIEGDQVGRLATLKSDARTAQYLGGDTQRKLALTQGDLAAYLMLVYLKPYQNLSPAAVLSALLICTIWLLYLWRVNVFHRLPVLLIPLLLVLGAASALTTFILGDGLSQLVPLEMGHGWVPDLVYSLLHIGVVEELAKILPVLLIILLTKIRIPNFKFRNHDSILHEPFDLVFLGSLSALGFSALENALYFNHFGLGIVYYRFLFSSLMHLAMTSIICYAWARARFIRSGNQLLGVLTGFGAAALIHGLFDYFILGPAARFSILSIFVALLLGREYYRMIRSTLNFSPTFDVQKSNSPRLTNFGLFISAALVLLTIVYLYDNFQYSTEFAAKQFPLLALLSLPSALALFTSLGKLNLIPGYLAPFIRLPSLKRRYPVQANPVANLGLGD
jgi:RsiW-degrading membrane proteinase PrsW (M82 family)/Flp pilus assembly protein TadD